MALMVKEKRKFNFWMLGLLAVAVAIGLYVILG